MAMFTHSVIYLYQVLDSLTELLFLTNLGAKAHRKIQNKNRKDELNNLVEMVANSTDSTTNHR